MSTDYSELTILNSSEDVAELQTFTAPANVSRVEFSTDEFTSVCPVTGQPDFCKLVIKYRPAKRCIESKSLKLYLRTFRDEPAFVEELSARIAEDIMKATAADTVSVTVDQGIRGGIRTVATTALFDDDKLARDLP